MSSILEAAEQLLLGTALQESDLRATVQDGGGPALGYFQMEPNSTQRHLGELPGIPRGSGGQGRSLAGVAAGTPEATILATIHRYAAAMTRVHYLRVSAPLPAAGDAMAMAEYWKDHYNTSGGAGSAEQFVGKWNTFQVAGLFPATG